MRETGHETLVTGKKSRVFFQKQDIASLNGEKVLEISETLLQSPQTVSQELVTVKTVTLTTYNPDESPLPADFFVLL
ncbi:hypothetical protein [Cytobacillus gottheilii]|uniref:Uncharacterized protein n=1 Tax=Cytobacillus gottheilii TaxID=859144 RepID=A0ABX8FHB5_9BACI|nr:hypothetical protein [Cytobacillus gottheilii]QVY63425.1 hypothetical protein J1899_10410 [Cytobacillus gottheilii]